MVISHGNNVNSLIKASIKTTVYFIQDLIVGVVLRRGLLCSQLHFTLDLLTVDHYGQEAEIGPLKEFLVHPSNLRPQKPFKTSYIIMWYTFLLSHLHSPSDTLKISHLIKFKDLPNLTTS